MEMDLLAQRVVHLISAEALAARAASASTRRSQSKGAAKAKEAG
jgi:hypothetical protein